MHILLKYMYTSEPFYSFVSELFRYWKMIDQTGHFESWNRGLLNICILSHSWKQQEVKCCKAGGFLDCYSSLIKENCLHFFLTSLCRFPVIFLKRIFSSSSGRFKVSSISFIARKQVNECPSVELRISL